MTRRGRAVLVVLLLFVPGISPAETELAGSVSVEPRVFPDAPAFPGQTGRGASFSAVAAPELRYEWHDGDDRLTISPFARYDVDDASRSHFDVREANWVRFADPWTLRVGLGRVFWGVTESRHLVDIVNQTDRVEDVDDEDKLGQPMVGISRYTEHGTYSVLVLPGFRERTFPADDARLRGPLPIAEDASVYESGAGDQRTDIAARWENALGRWDIGVSAFHGTSREPRLVPTPREPAGGAVLVPHYDVIGQLGLDLQHTRGAWLWKLEAIRRSGHGRAFSALAAGVEYTLFGVRGGGTDLGVLAEYLYDDRDTSAPRTAFDDDVFVGLRFALNDPSGTMVLLGTIADRAEHGVAGFVEAQRRLGQRWRLELELREFDDTDDPALAGIRQDSFITLRLERFF